MKDAFEQASAIMNTNELQEITKALARYGLGVCLPHMHEEDSGVAIALPPGVMSYEKNLRVSFRKFRSQEMQNTILVAWRWNGQEIEVCGSCCGHQDDE